MSLRALGIYREVEFSPGKVDADRAIMDSVLERLSAAGAATTALTAREFCDARPEHADIVLAMCQGPGALLRLSETERAGAAVINPAHAIRNCYRDLLAQGLAQAGVPIPSGVFIADAARAEPGMFEGLDVSRGVFVKRGGLHALGPGDVMRATGREELQSVLSGFVRRGVKSVYVQQAVEGRLFKFYGVSGGMYFAAVDQDGALAESVAYRLAPAAQNAAHALGLEVWGGDAILTGERFLVIDFNDWPSFGRVLEPAAGAIARRAITLQIQRRSRPARAWGEKSREAE